MYRPNFCCECGKKILRLHWHPWTSNRFCDDCARAQLKERLKRPLIAGVVLLSLGLVTGNAIRPSPPPLIIQRAASRTSNGNGSQGDANLGTGTPIVEDVYICGARTKKGTPCSRRMQGNVRCWQHKGMPAMLPPEKLLVKD